MKLILKAILALIALPVIAVVGATFFALPRTSGEQTFAEVAAPIAITRDSRGVPWIKAENEADAYFALGFAHAQDRLFQMELMRRSGQGRLSEVIGKSALPSDRLMRTLGLYRAAERNLEQIEPETAQVLGAYTAGVNAFINSGALLPIEFTLLWFKPEPWREADSLVWQKLMGLQLSGNWNDELLNAELIRMLGPDRAQELLINGSDAGPTTLAALSDRSTALLSLIADVVKPTLASNIWALSPLRTATGGALLANDPHLNFGAPNIWYLAGLSYPGTRLIGATIPGVPFHVLGHNGRLAWGMTTTHGDTQDLFVETVVDGDLYAAPGGPLPFGIRTEEIKVRFGEPELLSVRTSRHGPVISDVIESNHVDSAKYALALATPLLLDDDHTVDAIYRMARSTSAEDFLDATTMFHAPQQNLMFADSNGAIGYIAAGRVPIRANSDCNGLTPADGASGRCDWTGWISHRELPQSMDPVGGVLINANNKIAGADYPYLLAAEWPEPYRAQRITDIIADRAGITLQQTAGLQMDQVSLLARDMLPLLLERVGPSPQEPDLIEALRRWNGESERERSEPLLFNTWLAMLKSRLIADDLGTAFPSFYGDRPALIRAILTERVSWCDDTGTQPVETCEAQVQMAWSDTISWLKQHGGDDPASWRWDRFHVAQFRHPIFGFVPGLGDMTGFGIPTGGDNSSVNRGSPSRFSSRTPYSHRHGPGYRAIYDLADLSKSRFTVAGGQSGQILSRHFDDLLEGWRDGDYFELREPGPAESGADVMRLRPPR